MGGGEKKKTVFNRHETVVDEAAVAMMIVVFVVAVDVVVVAVVNCRLALVVDVEKMDEQEKREKYEEHDRRLLYIYKALSEFFPHEREPTRFHRLVLCVLHNLGSFEFYFRPHNGK